VAVGERRPRDARRQRGLLEGQAAEIVEHHRFAEAVGQGVDEAGERGEVGAVGRVGGLAEPTRERGLAIPTPP
jgi:hypothetical protein